MRLNWGNKLGPDNPVQEYLATLDTPDHDVVQDPGCV